AHAVSAVRKTRLLYFDRRRGVWLQNRSWDAAQAGRHALDRQGRQRHHRPALQQAQRTLPRFLGTPLRAKAGGCMTSLNLMCARYQTHPGEQMLVQGNIVGPKYFSTVGMQLLEGRDFSDRDNEKSPIVSIINEAMARRYFAGRSAIGQRFGSGTYNREIIGLVRDARVSSVQEAPVPMAYYFLPQMMAPAEAMEVRTAADPRWSVEEVRKVVTDVDPNLPIRSVTTLSDQVNENVTQERLVAFLTFVFGGLALGLACFGLYGVMSYAVSRRTPELGIRMARSEEHTSELQSRENLV